VSRALTFCFALLYAPTAALAYDEEVHTFLVRAGLNDPSLDVSLPPIAPEAASVVRAAIDHFVRTSTDAALVAEWTRRYPESFDAWAEKELLLMAPQANVFGIDRLPERTGTIRETIELGARQPDDDYRNRDRYAYDRDRRKMLDAAKNEVPADPALLNMGKLGALSSQAHAHYGLAEVEFSAETEVLKSEPRRFAVASGYPKGPVLTLAKEMAQAHLDLALLAALEGHAALSWLHTGQAFHYLQDVTNQIHTVQVGIFDFFVDATIQQLLMSFRTGGGYLGELRTMPSIGIDILTNHHVLSEALVKKRVVDALAGKTTPEGAKLIEAPKSDDPTFKAALDTALEPFGARAYAEEFGWLLTRATIEASSHEAAGVYAATRAIALPRYRKAGVLFDDKIEDPDQSIIAATDRDQAAYTELFTLQTRGFQRAGTAMRVWLAAHRSALAAIEDESERTRLRNVVIERLVKRQLRLLAESETRRRDYLATPPAPVTGPVRMPWVLAVEIFLLLSFLFLVRRLLRRRTRSDRIRL
jgi:hypothetical protein